MTSTTVVGTTGALEPVDDFRARAELWLRANMLRSSEAPEIDPDSDDVWIRARELQSRLYEGGFAGICFPREYGGLGLTPAHQAAFNLVASDYEMPTALNVPTLAICAATLLDMGTEEQKRRHIPKILAGEEVWCQFLSEPRGGSDLAGATTRADRDGDSWVINGSKLWSTASWAADYGLCLTRTNWDVPKHAGLSMFIVPVQARGVTISRIELANRTSDFCHAFFDDLRVSDADVVGAVDDGWTVASRQLVHERSSMGGGSPYISGRRHAVTRHSLDTERVAAAVGRWNDPIARDQVARDRIQQVVSQQLVGHIVEQVRAGVMDAAGNSILRLFSAQTRWNSLDTMLEVAGSTAVAGTSRTEIGRAAVGLQQLTRQAGSLGGGSTEMARNLISERLLKMPREFAADRGVAFKTVKNGS